MTSSSVGMPAAGDTIADRFCVLEPLGQGAWSVVYHALDVHNQTPIALKVLRPQAYKSPAMVERFRREAMFARRLSHPNTVRLFEQGQTSSGLLYIAMEHLSGNTLARELARLGPLGMERSLSLLAQICRGLAAIHTLGLVHRDLKPDNIFLCNDAPQGEDLVKILDFGISRPHASALQGGTIAALEGLTEAGQLLGTPLYMSPEQIQEEELTPATDIYALGHILYEMLTGRAAFDDGRNDPLSIIVRHLDSQELTVPLALRNHPVTPILKRAVAHDPSARFPNARAMLQSLRDVFPDACPSLDSLPDPSFTGHTQNIHTPQPSQPSQPLSLPAWIPEHHTLCSVLTEAIERAQPTYITLSSRGSLTPRTVLEHLHTHLRAQRTPCVCIEAEQAFSSFSIEDWFPSFHTSSPDHSPERIGTWFGTHIHTLPKHSATAHAQSLSHLSPAILRAQGQDRHARLREKLCASAANTTFVCIVHSATCLDPDSQHALADAVLHAHLRNLPFIVITSSLEDAPTPLSDHLHTALLEHGLLHTTHIRDPNNQETALFLNSEHPDLQAPLEALQDLVTFQGHTFDYIEEFALFVRNIIDLPEGATNALLDPFEDSLPKLILQHLNTFFPHDTPRGQRVRALLNAIALLGGQGTRASIESILAQHTPPITAQHTEDLIQSAVRLGWVQPSYDSNAYRLRTHTIPATLLDAMFASAPPDLHAQIIAAVHTLLHNTPYPSVRILHHITRLLRDAHAPWEMCHIQTEAANHAFHQLKFHTAYAWYSIVSQRSYELARTTFPEYLHRSKRSAKSSIEVVPQMRLALLELILFNRVDQARQTLEALIEDLSIERPSRFLYSIRARCLQILSSIQDDTPPTNTDLTLKALEHFEQLSSTNNIAQTQLDLAYIQSHTSSPDIDEHCMDETFGALVLAEHIRSPILQGLAHTQLSLFHTVRGTYQHGLTSAQNAMVHFAQVPAVALFEHARTQAALCNIYLNNTQRAFELIEAATHTQQWLSPWNAYTTALRTHTHTLTARALWDQAHETLLKEQHTHLFLHNTDQTLEIDVLLADLNLFAARSDLNETRERWQSLTERARACERYDLVHALQLRCETLGLTPTQHHPTDPLRTLWNAWHHNHPVPSEEEETTHTTPPWNTLRSLLLSTLPPHHALHNTTLHTMLSTHNIQDAIWVSLGLSLRKTNTSLSPHGTLLHPHILWRLPGHVS